MKRVVPASMSQLLLAEYCDYLGICSGLNYTQTSQSLLERRLTPRLEARNVESFADYLQLLRKEQAELHEVFEVLTTKETYFFRQDYQLAALVDEVLPVVVHQGGEHSRLTIWSAGCSTGEEAYTLAMLLSQSRSLAGWRIRVLGTDLCKSNIKTAVSGRYRPVSFRTTTQTQQEEFFHREGQSFRVNDDIRRMVHFSVGNLVNSGDVKSVGRVDVIFCRNVLIYFNESSRRSIIDMFYERLLPGGYLFLGHSESLLHMETDFSAVQLEGDLVYQRPPLERVFTPKLRTY